MQNEIPYYLQYYEITKSQLTYFSQKPNATKSLQMTMNPYLIGGSSITSNKPLMIFTGTDPENSVEDYLNAVTANLILNIVSRSVPMNTINGLYLINPVSTYSYQQTRMRNKMKHPYHIIYNNMK